MTLDSFIKEIQDDISSDCQLPINLPKRSILRIIKRSISWFHRNYEYAVKEVYYVIPHTILQTDKFKKEKKITLPNCIKAVIGVNQTGSSPNMFTNNPDYSVQRYIHEQSGEMSAVQGDHVMYRIMNDYYSDFLKTITQSPISWDYSITTNEFRVLGALPLFNKSLVLHCLEAIPDDKLFEDTYFYDFVKATCMINLGKILTTFKVPLPGEVEVDFDSIKEEGVELLKETKELIKNEEGNDIILIQNSF
jgi:hypothetical protein